MSEAITPAVKSRAHYEQLLAMLLDRSNPASPNFQPALAVSSQAVAPTQPAPVPPAPAEAYPRQQGRFTHGNPGGPGRPRKIHCVEHDCVTIVTNAISPQDLHDITRIAVAQAKEGDGAARRWIYQMAYRHSRTSINEAAALQETGITPDEHRMLLAQKHFGRQMEDVELYRQEVAAQVAAESAVAQPTPTPAPAAPAAPAAESTAAVASAPQQPAARDHGAANADVVEVRLAPSATPGQNAQKRSKTVENGADGHARRASNGRAELQVA